MVDQVLGHHLLIKVREHVTKGAGIWITISFLKAVVQKGWSL
jgi:hypothetical protein